MNKSWVDFDQVKRTVSLRMVLDHYGVSWLRKSGKEFRGRCPIHHRSGDVAGDGKGSGSFQVNHDKNAFKCFSCDAHGNVLDFVAAMERCSIREAGMKLQEWFSIPQTQPGQVAASGVNPSRVAKPNAAREATDIQLAAEEEPKVNERDEPNKSLAFALKGIDPGHSYLEQRGISRETAEVFGVGFFPGKGSMSGRVVVPIHDEFGELVAYVGRSIDGSEPKYKFPVGFKKAHVLFNLARVKAQRWGNDLDGLAVVVEGYFDCMKVWQAGLPVVALMGCSLSEQQERLLAENFLEVLLMLDGDRAGREAIAPIVARLATKVWVKDVVLPEGKQPDQLSPEELNQLFDQVL